MDYFCLKNRATQKNVHAGYYLSFKDCLEDAVTRNMNLDHIDLEGKNLEHANLDGASMQNAYLKNTNLSGANLSDSNLKHAVFHNAELFNTCLCNADLSGADFRYASFGATLINGANLSAALFSNLSSFDLDFIKAGPMDNCTFEDIHGEKHIMTKQPIILKGLFNTPIIILDQSIKIGAKMFPKAMTPALINMILNTEITEKFIQ